MEVIEDARAGDQRSFEALFRTYQPGLLRYLGGVSGSLAPDVAAATWESVAASLARFSGDGLAFRRWLFTIARRRLVDEVRRGARQPLSVAEVDDRPDPGASPDTALDQAVWADSVLTRIPTRQADVVALRVLGGLSVDEVADLLGITGGNVRVLTHRGLRAIEALLVASADSEPVEEISHIA